MARIAFVIPDMRGGGAERVALSLIKGFVERGHEVDLVLLNARGELLELLPPAVRVVDLAAARMRHAIKPLVRYLRERQPDAIQASMWPVTVIAVIARRLARSAAMLVVSEHSNVTWQFRDRPAHIRLIGASMRLFYPRADARVCVSKDVADDLSRVSGIARKEFAVVYNPIEQYGDRSFSTSPAVWTGTERRVLAVGTLKTEKNHALLLEAFARLHRRQPANLVILGEGPLRAALEQRANDLGIRDVTRFPGFQLDPAAYYQTADVFALTSNFEGLANVLIEALSAGVPVVSTDCRSGPREILDDGKYGRLVPLGDAEALADALEQALGDKTDRIRLQARAFEFRPELAVERYLSLMLGHSGQSSSC